MSWAIAGLEKQLNRLGYEIGVKELTEALSVEAHDLMVGLLAELKRQERRNVRLTNKLNRLRNIFPGRNPISLVSWIIQDWAYLNRMAVDEEGVPWVGKREARFLHRTEDWAVRLSDRMWECREILRGPGQRERVIADHREVIEKLDREGVGA